MPQTDTEDLRHRIEVSGLLSDDRKKKLFEKLPMLSAEQIKDLEVILGHEQKSFFTVTTAVIGSAVDRGNQDVLKGFDAFAAKAGKLGRIGEEQLVQESDKAKLEHFFDDSQS